MFAYLGRIDLKHSSISGRMQRMLIGHREQLGRGIRGATQLARLTIKELALKINLPENAVSKMELYGQGLTLARMEKMSQALGFPLEQLVNTSNATDIQGVMARRLGHDFLELPLFEEVLRESPEKMADSATRTLLLPALTPLDDVSRLYVWNVESEHVPEGVLRGDHVVIQWRKSIRSRDVVGRMVVAYHSDGHTVVGRIGPSDDDYQLHDGFPKSVGVTCREIEICGVIRWGWREF